MTSLTLRVECLRLDLRRKGFREIWITNFM